jgi:hypothetical protein
MAYEPKMSDVATLLSCITPSTHLALVFPSS